MDKFNLKKYLIEGIIYEFEDTGYWGTEQQPYFYKGNNPTVDLVITKGEQILLIKRSDDSDTEAGKWALPGGFINTDAEKGEEWKIGKETAEEAAIREVEEETGLDVNDIKEKIKFLGEFTGGNRDPRDNEEAFSTTHVFYLELPEEYHIGRLEGDDDAQAAKFVNLDLIKGNLAFDHEEIISQTLKISKNKKNGN